MGSLNSTIYVNLILSSLFVQNLIIIYDIWELWINSYHGFIGYLWIFHKVIQAKNWKKNGKRACRIRTSKAIFTVFGLDSLKNWFVNILWYELICSYQKWFYLTKWSEKMFFGMTWWHELYILETSDIFAHINKKQF